MIDLYGEAHTDEESRLVQTGVARHQPQLRTTRSGDYEPSQLRPTANSSWK